jgi:hypothetical protein
MTPEAIRLEVLKLLRIPDMASPDVSRFIERAKLLEAYVTGAEVVAAGEPKRAKQDE